MTYEERLAIYLTNVGAGSAQVWDSYVDNWKAEQHWDVGEDHLAIEDIMNSLKSMYYAVTSFNTQTIGGRYPIWGLFFELSPDGNGEPYELTLLKMIAAVISPDAHDDHRSAWVLLWDAYRASMYDKPFDAVYHETWVQRFKSWT